MRQSYDQMNTSCIAYMVRRSPKRSSYLGGFLHPFCIRCYFLYAQNGSGSEGSFTVVDDGMIEFEVGGSTLESEGF